MVLSYFDLQTEKERQPHTHCHRATGRATHSCRHTDTQAPLTHSHTHTATHTQLHTYRRRPSYSPGSPCTSSPVGPHPGTGRCTHPTPTNGHPSSSDLPSSWPLAWASLAGTHREARDPLLTPKAVRESNRSCERKRSPERVNESKRERNTHTHT